jgi:hypothetical protein
VTHEVQIEDHIFAIFRLGPFFGEVVVISKFDKDAPHMGRCGVLKIHRAAQNER